MHTNTTWLWKCCWFTPAPLFLPAQHPRHSSLPITCRATEPGMDPVPLFCNFWLTICSLHPTIRASLALLPPHRNLQLPDLVLPPSCGWALSLVALKERVGAGCCRTSLLVPAELQPLPLDKAGEAPQHVPGSIQPAMAVIADGECHSCHRRASYLVTA